MAGVLIVYIFIAVAVSNFLEKKLRWREDAHIPCAVFWPLFLLFWLLIDWPIIAIAWFYGRLIRRLGRKTVRRVVK